MICVIKDHYDFCMKTEYRVAKEGRIRETNQENITVSTGDMIFRNSEVVLAKVRNGGNFGCV